MRVCRRIHILRIRRSGNSVLLLPTSSVTRTAECVLYLSLGSQNDTVFDRRRVSCDCESRVHGNELEPCLGDPSNTHVGIPFDSIDNTFHGDKYGSRYVFNVRQVLQARRVSGVCDSVVFKVVKTDEVSH